MKRTSLVVITIVLIVMLVSNGAAIVVRADEASRTPLDPLTIPKWVNQLTGAPPVYVPITVVRDGNGNIIQENYDVTVTQFEQQILPSTDINGNPLGKTTVWGYGGIVKDAITGATLGYVRNSPAPTFEATRNVKVRVTWINNLTDLNGNPLSYMYAVDPTLHWANPYNLNMEQIMQDAIMGNAPRFPPGYAGAIGSNGLPGWNAQTPVPIVTHLHGGEVPSEYDGGPEQWFTADGLHGPNYATAEATYPNAAVYEYPNTQEPTTLWYHDHALGLTRINVFSGLAGFYLLRDPSDAIAASLPSGEFEVPLAIQDRSFYSDGSFSFVNEGINIEHPYWSPEYFGDTIMVNGLVWPNMDVKQATYRFRLLDGSNARFYTLSLRNQNTGELIPFTQIGSDGGYLKEPVQMTSLTISPGERADILVNFTGIATGTKILVENTAAGPFPDGDPVNPETTGQILQFTVKNGAGQTLAQLPAALNPTLSGAFPNLPAATKTRILTLTEAMNMATDSPSALFIDGQRYSAPITEFPLNGSTEDWVIVNPTADTHPIHLHLVQFQVVSRQPFDVARYFADWLSLNNATEYSLPLNHPTINVPSLEGYLTGPTVGPDANEVGWKDTVQMNPGEITTIRVRFMAQDGTGFKFDPTIGPGYVWHCHIVDHEDNEMMRPFKVIADSSVTPAPTNTPAATASPSTQVNTPQEPTSSLTTYVIIAIAVIAIVVIASAILIIKRRK